MPRTTTLSYRINGGALTACPFHLVKSDDRVLAPIKEYEEQKYPETAVSEIYPYTSKDTFAYEITFLAIGSFDTVNASVNAFYDSLFTADGDLLHALPITILNYWKGIEFVGYATSPNTVNHYPELTEYEKSAYIFTIPFYVADPATFKPITE
jgi:hypothetical protein